MTRDQFRGALVRVDLEKAQLELPSIANKEGVPLTGKPTVPTQTISDLESLRLAAEVANISIPQIVEPASQDVILKGMRFHYLDWGGQGPPVLWLHGGALTAHTFDLVCLAMRPRYRCIALDQRGHGNSDWSPVGDYRITAYADDIVALTDHLHWTRFILVGMSMGGINAIYYAAYHSDRLAGLVLIDVGPEVRSAGAARIHEFTSVEALDSVEDYVSRAVEFNPRRDARLLRRSLLHNLRQRPDGKWIWKWDPRWARQTHGGVAHEDPSYQSEVLWESVDRITCPTLVIRGDESDIFLDDDAQTLASRLTDGRWAKVSNAGHTIQGDNPAGLVEAIVSFLTEVGY